MLKKFVLTLLIALPILLFGQVEEEINPPENIKTIVFKGPNEDQFPILLLGESLHLSFDDVLATEQDYYYQIIHCDLNWEPSRLLKSQYLDGVDNQRIINYNNSYNTLQPYSNYQLNIPNDRVSLKVTGNYVLKVFNQYNELQFSRRFIVYNDVVKVAAQIKRSRDFEFLNEKQVVQFTINSAGFQWVNPKTEIKVVLLQNYYWPSAIYGIKPQFTLGNELVYKYDKETSFYGGNEFLYFDTSDLRAPSAAISKIEYRDLYHHILFTDLPRNDQPYTYFPDINGDFKVRTLQGRDPDREAEYSIVHFSLPYTAEIGLNDVYIFGKFNNYQLEEANKLVYNDQNGNLEKDILFKQGFYNYKYVMVDGEGKMYPNKIDGNFHFTENQYTILVYYRNFGDLYDSIIGVGTANSENITN